MDEIRYNPYLNGITVRAWLDLQPQGFTGPELKEAYAGLTESMEADSLLLESADFGELDAAYNPGDEVPESVLQAFVLEAITAKFGSMDSRMRAVSKAFRKLFSGTKSKSGNAIDIQGKPIVGKVKKQGGFATVMGSLPLSDGQKISIVFHAPEGDRGKMEKGDKLVAFRFLLNNRDITIAVAPRNMQEMTLDTMAMRISQLAAENSDKFTKNKSKREASAKKLKDLASSAKDAEAGRDKLMSDMATADGDIDQIDRDIHRAETTLEKIKDENESLMNRIDELKAKQKRHKDETGDTGAGKVKGGKAGKKADKATADQKAFDEANGKLAAELKGRGFKAATAKNGDTGFAIRLETKKGGESRGVTVSDIAADKTYSISLQYGSPKEVIDSGTRKCKTPRGLNGLIKKAMKWVDSYMKILKPAAAKSTEPEQPKAGDNPETSEASEPRTFSGKAVNAWKSAIKKQTGSTAPDSIKPSSVQPIFNAVVADNYKAEDLYEWLMQQENLKPKTKSTVEKVYAEMVTTNTPEVKTEQPEPDAEEVPAAPEPGEETPEIPEPAKEPEAPEASRETELTDMANEILSGKYDDLNGNALADMVDEILELEDMGDYDDLLDQVDAYVTALTRKAAA